MFIWLNALQAMGLIGMFIKFFIGSKYLTAHRTFNSLSHLFTSFEQCGLAIYFKEVKGAEKFLK
jgi:hypothetical protein